MSAERPLRILHVMRAPVGGLFRHVIDLARGQTARGHSVGIIADSTTGSKTAADTLANLNTTLAFGVTRVPMSRQVGPLDRSALAHVKKRAREADADWLHGHGAKGGAYARLAGGRALTAYTPHGGSVFYSPYSPAGLAYFAVERWLRARTGVALFESAFAQEAFRRFIGEPPFTRVVHNGISRDELQPIEPVSNPADIDFIGELRWRKGIDVLLQSLAQLAAAGWNGKAIFFGEGPDRKACEQMAAKLGLDAQVSFPGESRPRPAFASARLLVIPSRQESLPYIVLEAAAARMPMITTSVGGIPEIFGPDAGALVPAGDVAALVAAIKRMRGTSHADLFERLHERVARYFSVEAMTDAVLAAYAEAGNRRAGTVNDAGRN
jgi:glycosyltransferase involved in cell wall biosynthesis